MLIVGKYEIILKYLFVIFCVLSSGCERTQIELNRSKMSNTVLPLRCGSNAVCNT